MSVSGLSTHREPWLKRLRVAFCAPMAGEFATTSVDGSRIVRESSRITHPGGHGRLGSESCGFTLYLW
jgi:hypothetical protein